MPSKKVILSQCLFSNNLLEKLLFSRKNNNLSILAYHRIFPTINHSYPFEKGVMSCSPDEFDQQLKILKKHFKITSFNEVLECHKFKEKLDPNTLILTFDDGYADNFYNMMPIIESHNLTATVFVSTKYIDTGELFWVDRLAYKINNMPKGKLLLSNGHYEFDVNDSSREFVRKSISELCYSLPASQHFSLLDEVYQQIDIEPSQDEYDLARPMTWNEIKEMDQNGFEIGSHAITHRFLDRMTRDEIECELANSKSSIDRMLNKPTNTICYPAGKYNNDVIELAAKYYKCGCGYIHGTGVYNHEKRFTLPRIHVDDDVPLSLFKGNLALPEVFLI